MKKNPFGLGLLAAGLMLVLAGCPNGNENDRPPALTGLSISPSAPQTVSLGASLPLSVSALPTGADMGTITWETTPADASEWIGFDPPTRTGPATTITALSPSAAPILVTARSSHGPSVSLSVTVPGTGAEIGPLTLPVTWGFTLLPNPIIDEAGAWTMTAGGGRQSGEGNDNDAAMTTYGRREGSATFPAPPFSNMVLYPGNATGTGTTHGILWNTGGGWQGTEGPAGVSPTRIRVAGFGATEETAFLSIGGVPSSFRIIVDFAGTGGTPNPLHELVVLVDGEEVASFFTDQSSATSGQNAVRGIHDFRGPADGTVDIHLGLRGGGSRRVFQVSLVEPPPYYPLVGISLPATTSVVLGTPQQLVVTFDPPNASNQSISWSIADGGGEFVTVLGGLVTGLRAGAGETVRVSASSPEAGVADTFTDVSVGYAPVGSVVIEGESTLVAGGANLVLGARAEPAAYVENTAVSWRINGTNITVPGPIGEVNVVSFDGNELVLSSDAVYDTNVTVTARSVSLGAGYPVEESRIVEIVTTAPPAVSVEIAGPRFIRQAGEVVIYATVLPVYAASTYVSWALAPNSDDGRTPGAASIQGDEVGDSVTIRGLSPGWVTVTATSLAYDGGGEPIVASFDVQVAAVQTDATLIHRTLTRAGTASSPVYTETRPAFGAAPVVKPDGTLRIEGAGTIDNAHLAGNFVWIDTPVMHESFRVEVDFCLERTLLGVVHPNTKIGVFLSPDPDAEAQGDFHNSFTVVEGAIPPARGPQRARNHGAGDGFRNNSAIATPSAEEWAAAGVVTFGLQSTATEGIQNHFFLFDGVPVGNSNSGGATPALPDASSHVGIVVSSNGTSWPPGIHSEAAILEIRVWFDGIDGLATIVALDSGVRAWASDNDNDEDGDWVRAHLWDFGAGRISPTRAAAAADPSTGWFATPGNESGPGTIEGGANNTPATVTAAFGGTNLTMTLHGENAGDNGIRWVPEHTRPWSPALGRPALGMIQPNGGLENAIISISGMEGSFMVRVRYASGAGDGLGRLARIRQAAGAWQDGPTWTAGDGADHQNVMRTLEQSFEGSGIIEIGFDGAAIRFYDVEVLVPRQPSMGAP